MDFVLDMLRAQLGSATDPCALAGVGDVRVRLPVGSAPHPWREASGKSKPCAVAQRCGLATTLGPARREGRKRAGTREESARRASLDSRRTLEHVSRIGRVELPSKPEPKKEVLNVSHQTRPRMCSLFTATFHAHQVAGQGGESARSSTRVNLRPGWPTTTTWP